jgi:hypothetical protein
MHGTSRTKPAERAAATGVNAVVWIEPGRALIVRGGAGAELTSLELPIPSTPAVTPPALAEVAHSIGAVDRVLVLGMDEPGRRCPGSDGRGHARRTARGPALGATRESRPGLALERPSRASSASAPGISDTARIARAVRQGRATVRHTRSRDGRHSRAKGSPGEHHGAGSERATSLWRSEPRSEV